MMLPLSALIQSDLVEYHQRLAEGGNEPADIRLLMARCVEAIEDVHAGSRIIVDGALEAIENGDVEIATLILREAAKRLSPGEGASVH